MNKFLLLILIIVLTIVPLTGCWSYKEIDKLAIVSGMAIDKDSSGKGYKLTAEIINITSASKEPQFNSLKLESRGDTIFDCNRNMINISAKRLYWGHATTIIVSEEVAKDGLIPILDWIVRDSEPRLTIYIFVSKAKDAKEILNVQSVSTEIRSFELESMIISNKILSKTPNIQAYELIDDITTGGISPVIPTIGVVMNGGEKTTELSGGAILNKDALAGFMSLEDVKYYLFVRNQIKGGLLTINLGKGDSKDNATLEIFKNKTKITPKVSDGKLSMSIKVKTEVAIGELDTSIDFISKSGMEQLKGIAEKSLEGDILKTIKKIQEDFGLDIFGFGNIVKEQMPDLWKDISKDWDAIFKDLVVEVDADVHIRSSGHSSKTIKSH